MSGPPTPAALAAADQAFAQLNGDLDALVAATRKQLRRAGVLPTAGSLIYHTHETLEPLECAQLLATALVRLARQRRPGSARRRGRGLSADLVVVDEVPTWLPTATPAGRTPSGTGWPR